MVIAEAIEEGKWFLRHHSNPEHHQHNIDRASKHPLTHPTEDSLRL